MKEVKFIRGLVVENAIIHSSLDSMRYFTTTGSKACKDVFGAPVYLQTEGPKVEAKVAPLHCFNKGRGGDDIYIAYTEEVEDLLHIPFKLLKEEVDRCRAEIDLSTHRLEEIKNATFLQRLRFLVTGRIIQNDR